MTARDRREHARIGQSFKVKLSKAGMLHPFEGKTENMNQVGAFIKTKDWRHFQVNDEAVIEVILPPFFSGQDVPIGLQGEAVIANVDEENNGVAVQFVKSLKQFERTDRVELPGGIRYKRM